MTVNGRPVDIDVPESRYLSEVLREDLQLTGTKIGCAEAECGICTVLVNSTPVVSCVYPAFKAQGTQVQTIEGIMQDGELHPLQQAFLDHGAVQCGICTPGLIMTAKGLLDRKAALSESVTEADIRTALKDSYCRCTGYQSIINAILQASGQDVSRKPARRRTRSASRVRTRMPWQRSRERLVLQTTTGSRACSMLARNAPKFPTPVCGPLTRRRHVNSKASTRY
jgi:aerobic-type carbon monoxide dehydrogenase small subunit (CoxS/CutS family)